MPKVSRNGHSMTQKFSLTQEAYERLRADLLACRLQPGDVVTALFQPYSFTALGATGRVDEINFETQGITLAQALARANGLIDQRSNAKGVFVSIADGRERNGIRMPAWREVMSDQEIWEATAYVLSICQTNR